MQKAYDLEGALIKNPFYLFTEKVTYYFFKIFYRVDLIGQENIPDGGAILASNHCSYFDPMLIGSFIHREMYPLAKASHFKHPILGPILSHLHTLPVSSKNHNAKTFRLTLNYIKQGCLILIFPEGHCSTNGQLNPLKNGVAQLSLAANCPIVPIFIKGSFEIWPAQKSFPKLGGKMTIHVGIPIYPDSTSKHTYKESQKLLTNQLEQALKEMSLH